MRKILIILTLAAGLIADCALAQGSATSDPAAIASSLDRARFSEYGNKTDQLFGLQAIRKLLGPFPALCNKDGGSIRLGQSVGYIPGGRAHDGKSVPGISGASTIDCIQGDMPLWRISIGVSDGGFRSDSFLDKTFGVTYFGYLRTRYEPGRQIEEATKKDEQERMSAERQRQEFREARERCILNRTSKVKDFRDGIKTGDIVMAKSTRGLAVEVKRPLVFIQYDSSNPLNANRQFEWISIESVEPDIPHC